MLHSLEQGSAHARRARVWAIAGFILLGLALVGCLAAVVFLRKGDTAYRVACLGIVLPVLAVCAMAAMVVSGVSRLAVSPKVFLYVTVLTGTIGCLAIPFLALKGKAWGSMIPLEYPTGIDFRSGLYEPAAAFSTAHSAWPPLNLILGLPFTLLSQDIGYRVQVFMLVALGLCSAGLCADLGRRATGASSRSAKAMFAVMALWLVTSYGFLFEVERGNVDLYALVLSLLAVWSLLRFPRSAWLPAIFLALAINLKLYPAVFLVPLFWRHRWRALIPVVVTNAVLLLVAGPRNAWTFVKNIVQMEGSPALWQGNHSAVSFANGLHKALPWVPMATEYIFLAIPIVLWLVTVVLLVRRGWSQRGAVMVAAASVPLMNIIPPVSHDYKLVLLVFPLAVLGALLVEPGGSRLGSPVWRGVLLGLTGLEMAALAVSTKFWSGRLAYPQVGIGNKYPLIVLMQLLFLAVVLLLRREDYPEQLERGG